MFFLNPWLLLGLGAVAVPIIIHLTGRRRYKTVSWAAMDFLLESHRETARRLKLYQLLLLAARVAILASLAVALARPTLSGESWLASLGRGNQAVCIVIDSSYSMGYQPGDRTLFEEAVEMAKSIASGLSPSDSLSVILGSNRAEVVLQRESRPSAIKQALDELAPSSQITDLYPAAREAVRLLTESSGMQRSLYILTDGCRNAWRTERESDWRSLGALVASQPNSMNITIVLLGRPGSTNAAVTGIVFKDRMITVPQTVSVEVAAERWGPSQKEIHTFSVYLDGEEQGTFTASWSSPQGPARAAATFHFRAATTGNHFGWVEIEKDRLSADDRRYFTLSAGTGIPVLCVDGEPGERPEEAETFFLVAALSPRPPDQVHGPINATVIPAADLSSTRLEDYDVIVLANVAEILEREAETLKDRISAGAGLIVFPGDRVRPQAYAKLLNGGLIPSPLLDPVGTLTGDEDRVTLGQPNQRHPAMKWFRETHLAQLAQVGVYRWFPLSADSGRPPPTLLLPLSAGDPAAIEGQHGMGKTILFSFPADTEWSNFPTCPLYLPLLHSLVYYLAGEDRTATDLHVGETFSLRLPPGKELPSVSQIDGPLLGRMVAGKESWATFSETQTPGIFIVSTVEDGPAFAVNPDTSESDLTLSTQTEILKTLDGLPVRIRSVAEGLDRGVSPEGPVEIWPLFLGGALLLGLVELLLARRLDRPGPTARTMQA
jgi:hypothetical protein